MRKPVVLVTGASGEMGHGLIGTLSERADVVALDLQPLEPPAAEQCCDVQVGDILDEELLQRLASRYEFEAVYHLAALLSTRAEYTPLAAHRVNVTGTMNLLQLAADQGRERGRPVTFVFPSSIAVYGLPDLETKRARPSVTEDEFNEPITMYGCNKLYCEHLGRYFSEHFRQLDPAQHSRAVDFRAIRFPGLISSETVPSGGTSDFGPEMIHAAAKGAAYACFVAEEARLPFMAMRDAIQALLEVAAADAESLTQRVYNVTSFSLSAAEIRDRVVKEFPSADITFDVDAPRARIVDSWPGDVDDSPARRDWGWSPELDERGAFEDELFPKITKRYR